MKKLIKGIVDFRQKSLRDYCDKFSKLASRQSPDALFVACCDSRVVPNVFASSDPGDLFVLRNIGNLIPPYQPGSKVETSVSAAIEFSVISLGVSDIVICGHSECGAMQTLIDMHSNSNTPSPSLNNWLAHGLASYKKFENEYSKSKETITPCNCLSRVNILQQLENLKTYPCVAKKLHSHNLRIHGWWFDLTTADVYYYNTTKERFILMDENEASSLLAVL